MWANIVYAVEVGWDILKNLLPVIKKLKRSRRQRTLITKGKSPAGTPAQEIALLLATIENPKLLVGKSNFAPLVEIRRSLWAVRSKLERLSDYAIAARAEDSTETVSALNRLAGQWEKDTLPLLHTIVANAEAGEEIRRISQVWIAKLDKATKASPST